MIEFKDMSWSDALVALRVPFERLTVLRPLLEQPPMVALRRLIGDLERGDMWAATDSYHALTGALIGARCRRVSGDLFLDFLMHLLLMIPNEFSKSAALDEWDEPVCAAMRYDLTILGRLNGLNSVTLKRWVGERYRELKAKPRQARDAISAMSSAIWTGNTNRPLPTPSQEPASVPASAHLPGNLGETEWVSWRYANDELGKPYVADEALEEMYHRLMHHHDWGVLLDDVWNFHNAYGVGGIFLQSRVFRLQPDGVLATLGNGALPPEDAFTLYERERERLERNVIRFMQGERAKNMLITGPAGAGKTTQVLSLARELPEVRIVLAPGVGAQGLSRALEALSRQPLRFLLFLDELDFSAPGYPELRAALGLRGYLPENVLLCAAARTGDDTLFPMVVELKPPQLKEFIELVQNILLRSGQDEDFERIQNACIDHAAAKRPLSFQWAYAIADQLLEDDDGGTS